MSLENIITGCAYEDMVLLNKSRHDVGKCDNNVRIDTRIMEIKEQGNKILITLYFPLSKSKSNFDLKGFLEEYLHNEIMYITNITNPQFKSCFKYKSHDAYARSHEYYEKQRKTQLKEIEKNKTKKEHQSDIKPYESTIKDCMKVLTELVNSHPCNEDKGEGITVEKLAYLCLLEVRKGNGQKHVLLSSDDEINEGHTLYSGFIEFKNDYEDLPTHDNNDVTHCILLA